LGAEEKEERRDILTVMIKFGFIEVFFGVFSRLYTVWFIRKLRQREESGGNQMTKMPVYILYRKANNLISLLYKGFFSGDFCLLRLYVIKT
jgi:hypothetical protein